MRLQELNERGFIRSGRRGVSLVGKGRGEARKKAVPAFRLGLRRRLCPKTTFLTSAGEFLTQLVILTNLTGKTFWISLGYWACNLWTLRFKKKKEERFGLFPVDCGKDFLAFNWLVWSGQTWKEDLKKSSKNRIM